MNRLPAHLSKAILLLAAVMLPVQQLLAAACCCQQGRRGVHKETVKSEGNCCSKQQASCCTSNSEPKGSCCGHGDSGADEKPCRCPAGCYGNNAPDAVDPVTTERVSTDELVGVASLAAATVTADPTHVPAPTNAILSNLPSGSERCVLLCRYRL